MNQFQLQALKVENLKSQADLVFSQWKALKISIKHKKETLSDMEDQGNIGEETLAEVKGEIAAMDAYREELGEKHDALESQLSKLKKG